VGCLRHAGACLSPSVFLNLVWSLAGAGYLRCTRPSPVEKDAGGTLFGLCQLEEKLDQVAQSIDQVAEVFHFGRG
jgi:hypothetical protein